ncbi:hypothetical protein OJF2_74030 [Aquisphaera giovannonii]|uniref:Uncharacterized protein n=1 Tax=Aquisphaera giovannonii TaxID=406548 RepID=A0A5B9WEA0_9BACT|nr:hypothetical protein [Aquisphaera giovannonii]QEH38793.1 hypothetical protein OJF2_74030 [Aquisphaera giovannonii]
MPLPSTGRVGPIAALCLVTSASIPAASAGADDLNRALGKLSERIKRAADAEGETAVVLSPFTAPQRMAANGSPGIRKALEAELKRRDVLVKNGARLEVKGDYGEAEDPAGKAVVRIHGRLIDRDSGRSLAEHSVDVDNLTSIAGLVGATMSVPIEPVPADRERAIREGLSRPSAHVSSSRISAGPKSPFAIEILAGPSGGAIRPRTAEVINGQAYLNIRSSERYAIKLINDAPFEVAATLMIDGLGLFAFSEHPEYSYVIIPARSSGVITGWHRTNDEAEEFVVTEYPRSAAAERSLAPSPDLGVITACFAAAWPAGGNPPLDEGMEGRSVRATGRGPITRAELAEVERKTGRLRAAISVRYTKDDGPGAVPDRPE